jgi:hypothetical protein
MKTTLVIVMTLVISACSRKESEAAPPKMVPAAPKPAGSTPDQIVVIGANGKTEVLALGQIQLADKPEYTLSVNTPDSAVVGKDGIAAVVLTPKKGWKLNKEFPTKLAVQVTGSATLANASQTTAHAKKFEEKVGASWDVSFKPTAPGKLSFAGNFKFAVCTDSECVPKNEPLTFVIDVKP